MSQGSSKPNQKLLMGVELLHLLILLQAQILRSMVVYM